jgi:DNA-directed RNA polymerase subunit alpha
MPKRLAAVGDTLTDRYGQFSAQPFEKGFGSTVGNSLRRALLSSIEGAAITAVRIEGVEHEFSSIKGVVEDATDVILNLKRVPFRLHGEAPKTLTISKAGPGEVTASDILGDADVEVLDPSLHIATLNEDGALNIEMRLKQGKGYVSAERNFDEDLSLGYIPIDSVHTPVKKVNYTVDARRFGEDTEYDKLNIEVWTDGSIKPDDAIGLAAKLIKDHMAIFINFEEDSEDYSYEQAERPPWPHNDQLDRSVDELELSVRSYNCLKNAGIKTIRDLVQRTKREMLATKHFGNKSLKEIRDILRGMGLDFGMQFDVHGNPIAISSTAHEEVEVDYDDKYDQQGPIGDMNAIVDALGTETLQSIREVIQEESTARDYISQRYRTLINRQYLTGLSTGEADELSGLRSALDEMDKPYYETILRRLSELKSRVRSTDSTNVQEASLDAQD